MKVSFKKIFAFLRTMKFGLILLGMLCLVSVVGSVVPQGREEAFYLNNYSPLWSQLIITFKAYDIYHSSGFIALFIALALNLFLCSTVRFKNVINKIKKLSLAPSETQLKNPVKSMNYFSTDSIKDVFKSEGFKNIKCTTYDSTEIYYSNKNKIGYLGSWLIHIGILVIIVFYSYGQYTFFDTAVFGTPGSMQQLEGTNYIMNIEDFEIIYRDDGSVQQYITQGTLTDKDGTSLVSGKIYVNNPMRYDGYTFYQHSTGWASEVNVFKDGQNLGSEIVYDGTAYINNKEFIVIQMHHLYPDFVATETGFASKSNDLNNPKILYSLLYGGQRVDMNLVSPGQDVHWQDFTFNFNNPERYTYLSVNKMNGKVGALIGSIIIMLGLFLAFYMKPKQLIVERKAETIYIYGDYSADKKNSLKGNYQSKKDISI